MAHALPEGKSIIVTGAGRSLGAVIAERCAAEGAHVVATDITGDGAGKVVGHDITNIADWKRVVADAVTSNGRVDGLVNNAAIIYGARPFWDETPEEFARILDVNVMGTWLGLQVASRAMAESGGGSIVNISSTAGMAALPALAGYGTSKWAVRGLSKYAARELGPYGIRVNSVHPHSMRGTTMFPVSDADEIERFAANVPLRRVSEPKDVSDAVVYLLSDLARQVTGRELVVDAGATLGGA